MERPAGWAAVDKRGFAAPQFQVSIVFVSVLEIGRVAESGAVSVIRDMEPRQPKERKWCFQRVHKRCEKEEGEKEGWDDCNSNHDRKAGVILNRQPRRVTCE